MQSRVVNAGGIEFTFFRGRVSIMDTSGDEPIDLLDVDNETFSNFMDGVASTLLAMEPAILIMADDDLEAMLLIIVDAYVNCEENS